jgi:RimJ/RimL family protein N-acetyltransferase
VNIFLQKVEPEEWKTMSSMTHKVSFGSDRDSDHDRIDFALVAYNDEGPFGYCTVIEIDKNSAYMQHGGAFPNIEKSIYVSRCYALFVNWLRERYSVISTRILNQNVPMLKLAMAVGFRINGTYSEDGDVLVNFLWKKGYG